MSTMAQEIAQHRPDWPAIPDDLERAWSWLEGQGSGRSATGHSVLSPYPGHLGAAPVFSSVLTLDGWFAHGSAGFERLLPIAEAAGDGSLIALWRDDDEQVKAVVLSSEGGGYVVADDARALLTLLAVGYDELIEMNLGDAPEYPLPAEALAPLRSWVESELGESVPSEWSAVGDDDFSAWLDRELGVEAPEPAAPTPSGTTVSGEIVTLLALLGEADGPEVTARVSALTGAKTKDRLRSSGAALRRVGLETDSDRHGVKTIWIRLTDRAFGPIVKTAAPAYPRPAALIDGLSAESTRDDVLALLGSPEREGPTFVRYVVQGRYVHLAFEDGVLVQATLMVDAP